MTLEGKVAIVTGGNSGIGKAIALALARRHANIVIDYVAQEHATEELEHEVEALGDKKRVTRTAVSGRYICLLTQSVSTGCSVKRPPFSWSSRDAKTLGESKRGQQNQSTVPSVVTSAAVWRSPISPCSAIGG